MQIHMLGNSWITRVYFRRKNLEGCLLFYSYWACVRLLHTLDNTPLPATDQILISLWRAWIWRNRSLSLAQPSRTFNELLQRSRDKIHFDLYNGHAHLTKWVNPLISQFSKDKGYYTLHCVGSEVNRKWLGLWHCWRFSLWQYWILKV